MGWELPSMRKKKILFRVRSYPTQFRKFQKNSIKIKKLKNIISALFLAKTEWERLRMSKRKFSFRVRSNPTWSRKFQKNSIKIQKIKKHHSGFISCQKVMGEAENEKTKFFVLIPFQPNPILKIPKK